MTLKVEGKSAVKGNYFICQTFAGIVDAQNILEGIGCRNHSREFLLLSCEFNVQFVY